MYYPAPLDGRKKRLVARLAMEKRHHQRVPLSIKGRFLAQNGGEFPCEVCDISPGGLLLKSDFPPRGGRRIVLMIQGLNRLEGEVVREFEGGFAVALQASKRKRDQLGNALTFLLNKERLGIEEERRGGRQKRRARVYVQTMDGIRFHGQSLDISPVGMAIESKEPVRIGERLRVGRLEGTVMRLLDKGFAVQFDPPAPQETKPVIQTRPSPPPARILGDIGAELGETLPKAKAQ